jgi:hypothetical protein
LWDPADEVSFRQGDSVAFVTYSAVFNEHPHITAQTLVLDDTHAAKRYVAANWSVRIRRGDRAFPVVLDVLAQSRPMSCAGCGSMTLTTPTATTPAPRRSGQGDLAGIAETAAAADCHGCHGAGARSQQAEGITLL